MLLRFFSFLPVTAVVPNVLNGIQLCYSTTVNLSVCSTAKPTEAVNVRL